eukprot:2763610-Prymnesium_polylepis.1
MRCAWNSTLATVTLKYKYWRLTIRSDEIRECDEKDGVSMCLSNGTRGKCVGGQSGPTCKVCKDDWAPLRPHYYSKNDAKCVECPEASGKIAGMLSIGIVVGLKAWLVWIFFKLKPGQIPKTYVSVRRTHSVFRRIIRLVRDIISQTGLQPKIKIAVSFYQ